MSEGAREGMTTGWQPIETARKDKPILGWVNDGFGRREQMVVHWGEWTYNDEKCWIAGPECGEHSFRHPVTVLLWRDLPDDPAEPTP